MSTINLTKPTINLSKGQKISLAKECPELRKVMVGLGWKQAERYEERTVQPGFIGRMFGAQPHTERVRTGSDAEYDLDASVLMLRDGRFTEDSDLVYYGHKDTTGVHHHGDNLVGGEGNSDDEEIDIDLDNVPASVNKIEIFVCIYNGRQRNQSFKNISKMFIRLVDMSNGHEVCRYADDTICTEFGDCITLHFGELVRTTGGWEFTAIGRGTNDKNIAEFTKKYI